MLVSKASSIAAQALQTWLQTYKRYGCGDGSRANDPNNTKCEASKDPSLGEGGEGGRGRDWEGGAEHHHDAKHRSPTRAWIRISKSAAEILILNLVHNIAIVGGEGAGTHKTIPMHSHTPEI
jgi:hypothetical protein